MILWLEVTSKLPRFSIMVLKKNNKKQKGNRKSASVIPPNKVSANVDPIMNGINFKFIEKIFIGL